MLWTAAPSATSSEHGRREREIPVDRMSVTFSERQTNIVSAVNRNSEAL